MNTKLWRVTSRVFVVGVLLMVSSVVWAGDRVPGDPIPGANIMVGRSRWPSRSPTTSTATRRPPGSGTIVAQGTTDAQGSCTFNDLPAGTYFLKIETNGKRYKVSANDAGERITIAAPPSGDGTTTSRIAILPVVYTKTLGDVIVTVEIVGNALRSNLNFSKSNID